MRLSSHRAQFSGVTKLAGVSSQTASRMVRGANVVVPETRGQMLAAIKELGYRPNLTARSLSNRRTGAIHVIDAIPLLGGYARTFLSIVSELGRLSYQTSVAGSPRDQNPTLDQLVPPGMDGIVVLGGRAQSMDLVLVVHGRAPAALVGQRFDLPGDVVGVAIDRDAVARKATNHLLELGRQRLLHTCDPSDWLGAHERRDDFSAACRETGIEPVKVSSDSWEACSGYALGEHFPSDIDGLFASNDHLALGALCWLAGHGQAIPGDVAVVDVDDVNGVDSFLPPLITIRQPHQDMGACTVGYLVELTVGGPARHTILTPELVIRESTKGH